MADTSPRSGWQLHLFGSRAVQLALASRLAVVVACLLSDALLPDHSPDDSVARAPEGVPRALLAFTRWDAARFLRVAELGYDREESYAHLPLLPLAIRVLAGALGALGLHPPTALVVSGVLLANGAFVVSAWALYRLGYRVLGSRGVAMRAVEIYCLSPSNVFLSTIYTESPYAACTFGGLLLLANGRRLPASALLAGATALRSNGLLNCGFIVHEALVRVVEVRKEGGRGLPWLVLRTVLCCVVVAAPYFAFEAFAFRRECQVAAPPTWCAGDVPSVYKHVQATYWENGFLVYFQWRQFPNFLLAAPSLAIAAFGVATCLSAFMQDVRRFESAAEAFAKSPLLPHAMHWGFIAVSLFLCANVQIVTRVVAVSCPLHHWFLASFLARGGPPSLHRRLLWAYIIVWNAVGIILHPNFLPWT